MNLTFSLRALAARNSLQMTGLVCCAVADTVAIRPWRKVRTPAFWFDHSVSPIKLAIIAVHVVVPI